MRNLIDIMEYHRPREIQDFAVNFDKEIINTRVQSQAARKNPKWKRAIIAAMKRYDFHLIGTGINGAVFGNTSYPYVIKVYRTDRGYDEWIHFAKTHLGNPYVPVIRGNVMRLNSIFSMVRVEKLQKVGIVRAYELINQIDALTSMTWRERNSDGEKFPLLDIANFISDWEPVSDLTHHNIMARPNGELVIIDPLYIEPGREIDW